MARRHRSIEQLAQRRRRVHAQRRASRSTITLSKPRIGNSPTRHHGHRIAVDDDLEPKKRPHRLHHGDECSTNPPIVVNGFIVRSSLSDHRPSAAPPEGVAPLCFSAPLCEFPRDQGQGTDVSGEQDAFEIVNAGAAPHLIFVCDHASNALPPEYGALGLDPQLFQRHIAYDIGAADVTRAMAQAFNAPAVLGCYSRLLIDLNRGADDPTLVMKLSDGAVIPGNAKADSAEVAIANAPLLSPVSRRDRSARSRERARKASCRSSSRSIPSRPNGAARNVRGKWASSGTTKTAASRCRCSKRCAAKAISPSATTNPIPANSKATAWSSTRLRTALRTC